jgi:hypothetical protein
MPVVNPLGAVNDTDEDESSTTPHETASGHEGTSDGDSDGGYSDDDPRANLATTASMQSFISKTGTSASDADSDDTPVRKNVRLVSRVDQLLLPRSSRTALALAFGLLLAVASAVMVGSLSSVDAFHSAARDAFTTNRRAFQIEAAYATLATAAGSYVTASIARVPTYVEDLSAAASRVPSAVVTLRAAVGAGDSTASDDDARVARWWLDARRTAPGAAPPPVISADFGTCATAATQATLSAVVDSDPSAADEADAALFASAPSVDAVVAAATWSVALVSSIDGVSDASLAAAFDAAGVPAGATSTRAQIASASYDAALRTGAIASELAETRLGTAANGRLDGVVSSKAVGRVVDANNAALGGFVYRDIQRAMAVGTWAAAARAALVPLNVSLGAVARSTSPDINSAARALARSFAGTLAAVDEVAAAYAPHGAPASGHAPVVAAVEWFAAAERRVAAFPFNRSALGRLAAQGAIDAAFLQRLPSFRSLDASALGGVVPVAADLVPSCSARFDSVLREANATRMWARGLLAVHSEQDASFVRDGDLAAPYRDDLIVALVLGLVGIVAVTLYGQWGVAARLSASAMPYRSFSAWWWGVALVMAATVSWCAALALREVNEGGPARGAARADFVGGAWRRRTDESQSASLFDALSASMSVNGPDAAVLAAAVSTRANSTSLDVNQAMRRSVVDAFVALSRTTDATDPTAASAELEDELAGSALLRQALLADAADKGGEVLWLPPTYFAPGGSALRDSTSPAGRQQAACAAALGSRAAIALNALSLVAGVEIRRDTVSATDSTDAAASRAGNLRAAFGAWDASKASADAICAASTVAAHFNAVTQHTSTLVERARARARRLSDADAQRGADGTLPVAPLRLRAATLLASQRATVHAVVQSALVDLPQADERLASASVLGYAGLTVPLKRRIVWGHIGACTLVHVVMLLLWRLLFGASWTLF